MTCVFCFGFLTKPFPFLTHPSNRQQNVVNIPHHVIVGGVHHEIDIMKEYDRDALKRIDHTGGADIILVFNRGLRLYGDGKAMQGKTRAQRTQEESTITALLKALHGGVLVAGCTLFSRGAVHSAGYETFSPNGSVLIAQRQQGQGMQNREFVDADHPPTPVHLLNGDCMGFWRLHPNEWGASLKGLLPRFVKGNDALRATEDNRRKLFFHNYTEEEGIEPAAIKNIQYYDVHSEYESSFRVFGSLLGELISAEANHSVLNVMDDACFYKLEKLNAVLRGHRGAFLELQHLLNVIENAQDKSYFTQLAPFIEKMHASIAQLGEHLLTSKEYYEERQDPLTWGWRRVFEAELPPVSSHFQKIVAFIQRHDIDGATAQLKTSTALMRTEFESLHSKVRLVELKNWNEIGWLFSSLVLRLQQAQKLPQTSIVSPLCIAAGANAGLAIDTLTSPHSILEFESMYFPHNDHIRNTLQEVNVHSGVVHPPNWSLQRVMVVWLLPCCLCCGFANEAVTLILGMLEQNVDVWIATPVDGCICDRLTPSTQRILRSRHIDGVLVDKIAAEGKIKVVVMLHGVPRDFGGMLMHGRISKRDDKILIGRAMYELTVVPKDYIRTLNEMVDEVWAPSVFVKELFENPDNRVTKPIRVVHEAVDTNIFHSLPREPTSIPPESVSEKDLLQFGSAGLPNNFKFLSTFKWEIRKGWDVLLGAYFRAFSSKDNVSLYISSIPYEASPPATRTAIIASVQEIILSLELQGHDVTTLPHVCIIHSRLPEKDMPSLFGEAQAFVLPTRGEGWGLPMLEAMSSGLPTIATAWSGHMDFMNKGNSYLLQYDIEEVLKENHYGWEKNKSWAQPNGTHLIQLMKDVRYGGEKAKAVGVKAEKEVCC